MALWRKIMESSFWPFSIFLSLHSSCILWSRPERRRRPEQNDWKKSCWKLQKRRKSASFVSTWSMWEQQNVAFVANALLKVVNKANYFKISSSKCGFCCKRVALSKQANYFKFCWVLYFLLCSFSTNYKRIIQYLPCWFANLRPSFASLFPHRSTQSWPTFLLLLDLAEWSSTK